MTSLNEVEVDATNPPNTTSEAVLRHLTARTTINNETNKDMNNLCKSEFNRLREKGESKNNRLNESSQIGEEHDPQWVSHTGDDR